MTALSVGPAGLPDDSSRCSSCRDKLLARLGENRRPPDYEFPLFNILSCSKKPGYLSYIQH